MLHLHTKPLKISNFLADFQRFLFYPLFEEAESMDAARQGLLEFAGSEEAAQQMAESAARDAQAELARVRAKNTMPEAPAPVVPNLDGLSLIQKRKAQQEA